MEIIIYSPNFYLHIQDAVVLIQYCIDGIIEIASQNQNLIVIFLYIAVFILGSLWGSFVCMYIQASIRWKCCN